MFIERALQLLAAFVAHWGPAKLIAACERMPLCYWKPMAKGLAEIEALARRAIYDLAQTLKVRAFVARGPRPVVAKTRVEVVKIDPLRFRRMMLPNPLPRISFIPEQAWEKPPEQWKVRFCVLGARREHARPRPVASASGRQEPSPPSATPARRPLERNEKPAGWKPALRAGGARSEPRGPHFVGPVRIYETRCNVEREQAWRDYWMAPADQDQWVEPAPDVYKDTWPLAKRMEAARRALADPLRWARPLARRLARDAALAVRAVKKFLERPAPEDETPRADAPEAPPDPDPRE